MIPALISSLLALSVVSNWIMQRGVTVGIYEEPPAYRFAQWGWFVDWRGEKQAFFIVKLPSYSWEWDLRTRDYRWFQYAICWRWNHRGRMWQHGYAIPA